ncbi:hypothetical protein F0U60_12060 [Archangium minus]|uniref:Lipoprotein n=1 Tax=Archangium minus TaxID=83450 RepID=A0ABY9WPS9_9BACT|nr:hypothetical protein F0U60_12060 [Archangium minus]
MREYGRHWRGVWIAAVLVHAAAGCAEDSQRVPVVPEQEVGEVGEDASFAPERSESAPWGRGPALSCEEIRPAALGPSRSFITRANAPEADCGPGTGDGAGYLALYNAGQFGAQAWNVVFRDGTDTGNLLTGGDLALGVIPQPSGFHIVRIPPGGATLTVYSSRGELLRTVPLTDAGNVPFDVAEDPRGGVLVAQWASGEGDTQVLRFQFFDTRGQPRSEPVVLRSAPRSEERSVIAGVDTRGRVLLLLREPGSDTWVGQWLQRDGAALTEPFAVPLPADASSVVLEPLVEGGLALRVEGEWVLRFPSEEAEALPAPAWLAAHPGSDLYRIRNGRAYALVPPPTLVEGSGCRESIRLFSSDGTDCGELVLPFGAGTCLGRPGIALDGTVIQQLQLAIPAADQCAWRWWPRLLR